MRPPIHVNNMGEPGHCSVGDNGTCPFGFTKDEHFDTAQKAREWYADQQGGSFVDYDYSKSAATINENNAQYFSIVDTETGSVFSANSYVIEMPELDDFEREEFFDNPAAFIPDDAQRIYEVGNLSSFVRPVIIEPDTGLSVSADSGSIFAVDSGDDRIDFDELLESGSYLREVADEYGLMVFGE